MPRRDPTARRPQDKTLLNQEGLQHILNRTALFRQSRSQAIDTHRAAIELLDHGQQQPSIQMIKALSVNVQQIERSLRGCAITASIGLHLGVITDTT